MATLGVTPEIVTCSAIHAWRGRRAAAPHIHTSAPIYGGRLGIATKSRFFDPGGYSKVKRLQMKRDGNAN